MNKSCVFRVPVDSKDNIIHHFGLTKVLSNDRTSIYQNKEMRFSIDQKVIRVLVFNENNINLVENLRNYFYGEEYERI